MSRLITVGIECKTGSVRQAFEGTFSKKTGYILTQAKQGGAADVFILELDEANPQRTFLLIRSTVGSAPQTEIFLTAGRTDTQMMLEAFRLGVKEFIPQPINPQELEAALTRFEDRLRSRIPTRELKQGKVISIIGAKGGVGTSTVATNLAAGTKHAAPSHSIALMDLNLQNSDLPVFLDLPGSSGLRDLSQDLSRLDETIHRVSSHSNLVPAGPLKDSWQYPGGFRDGTPARLDSGEAAAITPGGGAVTERYRCGVDFPHTCGSCRWLIGRGWRTAICQRSSLHQPTGIRFLERRSEARSHAGVAPDTVQRDRNGATNLAAISRNRAP